FLKPSVAGFLLQKIGVIESLLEKFAVGTESIAK
uniref:Phosphoglycerate kinase (Fragments) n=1 Tax=Pseudotsuga menziesii TaxID=3357 RepID=PGK_PSEMZ|nr:RecName: Full=Phosphoglycerate kinase [Pseudotsuga menziesii]